MMRNDTASGNGDTCAICLRSLLTEQGRQTLHPCQHTFHESCLRELRRKGENNLCPLCRQENKSLTTKKQLWEDFFGRAGSRDYSEASRIVEEIVDEIEPENSAALEWLVGFASGLGGASKNRDKYHRLRKDLEDSPDFNEPHDLSDVSQLRRDSRHCLGTMLHLLLRAKTFSQKADMLELVRQMLATMLAQVLTVKKSPLEGCFAAYCLTGEAIASVAASVHTGEEPLSYDAETIALGFAEGCCFFSVLNLNMEHRVEPCALQAAFACAMLSVLLKCPESLLVGVGSSAKIVNHPGLSGQFGTVVQRMESSTTWKVLLHSAGTPLVELEDFFLEPSDRKPLTVPSTACPMTLPEVSSDKHSALSCYEIQVAVRAIFEQASTNYDALSRNQFVNGSADSTASCSNSTGNTVLGFDSLDIDEQASIQSSFEEVRARAQREEHTARLLEVMHFRSNRTIPSAFPPALSAMVILEIRRYQRPVLVKLLEIPEVQARVAALEAVGLHFELEGGSAKFFGLPEQYHPLLRALQIKGLALKFYNVVTTACLEATIRSKINEMRSDRVLVNSRKKVKLCPLVVKNMSINIDGIASSSCSGTASFAHSAPP